jgi:hypothetical protein
MTPTTTEGVLSRVIVCPSAAAELVPPEIVADDHDGRTAGTVFFRGEAAAEGGRQAEGGKEIRRDARSGQGTGRGAVCATESHGTAGGRGEVDKNFAAVVAPLAQGEIGEIECVGPRVGVIEGLVKPDKPVRLGKRQRP